MNKKMTTVLTHRGLDPSKKNYFGESTFEAFRDQLSRGFGLEIDIQFTKNDDIVIFHANKFLGKNLPDVLDEHPELTGLDNLLVMFKEMTKGSDQMLAMHLKSPWQEPKYLDLFLGKISKLDRSKFLVFDLKPEAAKYLRERDADIQLAASVAHPYDIERYNDAVGGTLISLDDIVKLRDVFDWAWLDEWDRADRGSKKKKFYTQETFDLLRKNKIKIGLVTPELHSTSPGLLGGEKHEDASDPTVLKARITEILLLDPDAVCTDYPDMAREILSA